MKKLLKSIFILAFLSCVVVVFPQKDKAKKKEIKLKLKTEVNGEKFEWDTVFTKDGKKNHFEIGEFLKKRFPNLDTNAVKHITMEIDNDGKKIEMVTRGKLGDIKSHRIKLLSGKKKVHVYMDGDQKDKKGNKIKSLSKVYVYSSDKDDDVDIDIDEDFYFDGDLDVKVEILEDRLKDLDKVIKLELDEKMNVFVKKFDSLDNEYKFVISPDMKDIEDKLIELKERMNKIKVIHKDGLIHIHKLGEDGEEIETIDLKLDKIKELKELEKLKVLEEMDFNVHVDDDVVFIHKGHDGDKNAVKIITGYKDKTLRFSEGLNDEDTRFLADQGFKDTDNNLKVKRASLYSENDSNYHLKFNLHAEGRVNIMLVDDKGKVILKDKVKKVVGLYNKELGLTKDDAGTYYLYITHNGECYASKIKLD